MSKIIDIPPVTRACNLCSSPDITMTFTHPVYYLFVMVNNACQANCKFCTQHGEVQPFDFEKFKGVVNELREIADTTMCRLQKVNFTGGEPLLDVDKFRRVQKIVFDKFTFNEVNGNVILNTNGIHLTELDEDIMKNIGKLSLSRHHYDDDKNFEIFQTHTLPTVKDIQAFIGRFGTHKLWLRCNMIKDYIDKPEEIMNYCDWAVNIGAKHVGFSSLIDLNDYCKEMFVPFDKLPDDKRFCPIIDHFRYDSENKLCCNCFRNIYYQDPEDDNKWCDIVSWNRNIDAPSPIDGVLVFDGQNLRHGFFGEIIC